MARNFDLKAFQITGLPMLTSAGCATRCRRLIDRIEPPAQLAIVADPRHLMYLANLPVEPISWSSPPPGILAIDSAGRSTLFTDNLATGGRKENYADREEIVFWYDHRTSPGDRRRAVLEHFLTWLPALDGPIAMEMRAVPSEIHKRVAQQVPPDQIVSLDDELLAMRRAKDGDELELMRRCIRAGEAGHARAWDTVRPGVSELEIYGEIARACIEQAGAPVVVYGDFCSGPRTWLERGGPPTARKLERGDLMLLDFSVVIGGYRGDFTNTIAVGGKPTGEQRRLFELCQAAMAAGERALRAGARAADVFQCVNQPLSHADPNLQLTGHAGHGIGLAHPEPPIIVHQSDDSLTEHDLITLEPGAYVKDVGGMRFENNYRITAGGHEKLTRHYIGLARD